MSNDRETTPKEHDLQKDRLIRSLIADLRQERLCREQESRIVSQKADGIKQWVVSRLKELEAQNESLRRQNVKCAAQLQVLNSRTEKTKGYKCATSMAHSVSGALPVYREVEMDYNRTSEDSGMTSDAPDYYCSSQEQGHKILCHSPEEYGNDFGEKTREREGNEWVNEQKPVPTPRKSKVSDAKVQIDNFGQNAPNNISRVHNCECQSPESPYDSLVDDRESRYTADYVNLERFGPFLGDPGGLFANSREDIVNQSIPTLPQHRLGWKEKLDILAAKCLESATNEKDWCQLSNQAFNGTTTGNSDLNRMEQNLPCFSVGFANVPNAGDNSRHESSWSNEGHSKSADDQLSRGLRTVPHSDDEQPMLKDDEADEADYALPPDAEFGFSRLRSTMNDDLEAGESAFMCTKEGTNEKLEKSGYLISISDKSLKRRYCTLKNGHLHFYKSQKDESRNELPLMNLSLTEIISVSRFVGKTASHGFQLHTVSNSYLKYTSDNANTSEQWLRLLTRIVFDESIPRGGQPEPTATGTSVEGWLHRTKDGRGKRFFGVLHGSRLAMFKSREHLVTLTWTPFAADSTSCNANDYSQCFQCFIYYRNRRTNILP